MLKDTPKRDRNSWVVWGESGKYPDLIIELLSNSTAKVDRTLKKELYQNRFRTPEYFWFSPESLEFAGFRLIGNRYQEIVPTSRGQLWSEVLDLYLGIDAGKLHYFAPDGTLIPTPEEAAEQERLQKEIAQQQVEQERLQKEIAQQQVEQERLQKEIAQQQVEQLRERLRSLGNDDNLV